MVPRIERAIDAFVRAMMQQNQPVPPAPREARMLAVRRALAKIGIDFDPSPGEDEPWEKRKSVVGETVYMETASLALAYDALMMTFLQGTLSTSPDIPDPLNPRARALWADIKRRLRIQEYLWEDTLPLKTNC
ncbi:hypothetical protein D6833_10985 [Candidatus Parcubacteria bacterium]|nr:MAG: hypothetical protein D6833_10985 [Candidatus Parcubacteria bacterium]